MILKRGYVAKDGRRDHTLVVRWFRDGALAAQVERDLISDTVTANFSSISRLHLEQVCEFKRLVEDVEYHVNLLRNVKKQDAKKFVLLIGEKEKA